MYKYLGDRNTVVCFTPCAAGVSMTTALGFNVEDGQLRQKHVWGLREKKGARVVMWLRNPLERFLTQLKFFQGMTTDEAMNAIAERAGWAPDPHYVSQVEQHSYGSVFLPTVVYPFDNLTATWAQEFGSEYPLGQLNASTHVKPTLNAEEVDRVKDWHKMDYWLASQEFVVGGQGWPRVDMPLSVPSKEGVTLPPNHIFNSS